MDPSNNLAVLDIFAQIRVIGEIDDDFKLKANIKFNNTLISNLQATIDFKRL